MKLMNASLLTVLFMSSVTMAQTTVYKYGIQPSFTVKKSCVNEKESEISQVRIYIDQAEMKKSNSDIVMSEAKVTACVIGGKFIKKSMELPLPAELLSGEEVRLGQRTLSTGKFRSIDVKKSKSTPGSYEITFYTNQGPWEVINPVVIEPKKKQDPAPKKLSLKIVKYGTWINANFRLVEKQ